MEIRKIKSIEKEIVVDCLCDKCSNTCFDEANNHLGFHGILDVSYGSVYFNKDYEDGDMLVMDLCEKCSYELISSFFGKLQLYGK